MKASERRRRFAVHDDHRIVEHSLQRALAFGLGVCSAVAASLLLGAVLQPNPPASAFDLLHLAFVVFYMSMFVTAYVGFAAMSSHFVAEVLLAFVMNRRAARSRWALAIGFVGGALTFLSMILAPDWFYYFYWEFTALSVLIGVAFGSRLQSTAGARLKDRLARQSRSPSIAHETTT